MRSIPAEEVLSIVEDLIDHPLDQRDNLVQLRCAGDVGMQTAVFALLADIDSAREFFDEPEESSSAQRFAAAVEGESTVVGDFVLLKRINSGGYGDVYLAQHRHNPLRIAAIKLLRPDMDTDAVRRWFERERNVLGRFSHPNIARLLSDGFTPMLNRPYIAMEFASKHPITHKTDISSVEPGLSLIQYANENRLSITKRLEFFGQACDAIAYANSVNVIHRDLKHEHVLVTLASGRPEVKILDFGVFKSDVAEELLPESPTTGGLKAPATPQWQSPEVKAGKSADKRTDVYHLGLILHDLLSGCRSMPDQLLAHAYNRLDRPSRSAIAAGRSSSDRSLARILRGELSKIVNKALDADPDKRYASAEELRDDLRSYISKRPVKAVSSTRTYRARKWLVRNALASALISAMILIGIGWGVHAGFTIKELRIEKQKVEIERNEVKKQRSQSDTYRSWIVETIKANKPEESRGKEKTVNEVFQKFTQLVDREGIDPLLKAELQEQLAEVFFSLGDIEHSKASIQPCFETRKRLLGPDNRQTLIAEAHLATVLGRLRKQTTAKDLADDAALGRRLAIGLGDTAEITVGFRRNLALEQAQAGDWNSASSTFNELYQVLLKERGPSDPGTALLLNDLAYCADHIGDISRAESLHRQVLAIRSKNYGADHPDTIDAGVKLGLFLVKNSRAKEAVPILELAVASAAKVFPDKHPGRFMAEQALALGLLGSERVERLEAVFRPIVITRKRVYGELAPETLSAILYWAVGLSSTDQDKLAIETLESTLKRAWNDANVADEDIFPLRDFLADIYEDRSQADKASGWKNRKRELGSSAKSRSVVPVEQ